MAEEIRFEFGSNWQNFLKSAPPEAIKSAQRDIEAWIGPELVKGKTVLDVGSGSGIHSLAFFLLGARRIVSFDYDLNSVQATRSLWRSVGEPENWSVLQGSVLDSDFLSALTRGKEFDIVYSWGVLHHTGAMWQAIENVCELVDHGGLLWLALYAKGPRYEKIVAMKQKYNRSSRIVKWAMERRYISRLILMRLRRFALDLKRRHLGKLENPFRWNRRKERGMDIYHDIVDWLGGLPYEEASTDEVIRFMRRKDFVLEKIHTSPQGGNNIFIFVRHQTLEPSPFSGV